MNRLAIALLMLSTGTAAGMNIPCHVVGADGKPSGDTIVVTPYKGHAEISIGANDGISVPYYGNANGAGWEYQNERWDIIMGKSSPSMLSVMVIDSEDEYTCGGKASLSE